MPVLPSQAAESEKEAVQGFGKFFWCLRVHVSVFNGALDEGMCCHAQLQCNLLCPAGCGCLGLVWLGVSGWVQCGFWQVGVQVVLGPTECGLVPVTDGEPYHHAAAVGCGFMLCAGTMCPEAGCLGGLLAVGATLSMGEHFDVVIGVQNH